MKIKIIDKALKLSGIKQYTKEEKDEQLRQQALRRQKLIELLEIKQSWCICFGDEIPKKRNGIYEISNFTPRDIWMEPLLLFNTIIAFKPEQFYHKIDMYCLKWQPLLSTHKLTVRFDDPTSQEHTMMLLNKYPKKLQSRILFHFTTHSPFIPLYAPPVHPSSLVSYHTKNEVFNKLCEFFLSGRIALHDFEGTLGSDYDVWKHVMYNLLPEDEQVYHTYLIVKPSTVITDEMVEKQYMNEVITLTEYSDYKFPDRKKLKDIKSMSWPQPYEYGICIICNNDIDKGLIKCFNCDNLICKSCLRRCFLDEETRQGSFLIMHRKFCIKSGTNKQINVIPAPEPGYLKELCYNGRKAALHRIEVANRPIDDTVEVVEEEYIDYEAIAAEELRLQREKELQEKQLLECPPALQSIQHSLGKYVKKFVHIRKEILKFQHKLDEPGHADNYYDRLRRLKSEDIDKIMKQKPHFESIIDSIKELNLPGNPSIQSIDECMQCLTSLEMLSIMTSVAQYEQMLGITHEHSNEQNNEHSNEHGNEDHVE